MFQITEPVELSREQYILQEQRNPRALPLCLIPWLPSSPSHTLYTQQSYVTISVGSRSCLCNLITSSTDIMRSNLWSFVQKHRWNNPGLQQVFRQRRNLVTQPYPVSWQFLGTHWNTLICAVENLSMSCDLCYERFKGDWENHQISLSRHLQGHRALTPLPLWSVSCVDHAWVELPGDWSRRVFGPEDRPVVGAGERSERGQGPGQGLQTRNQRRILQ